jgi:hypothetical protein
LPDCRQPDPLQLATRGFSAALGLALIGPVIAPGIK